MTTEIQEYSKTDAALADLAQRYKGVVFDVTTKDGMSTAVKGRAELRTLRIDLEKTRKEIKAPALLRCQQIDSEAKRITLELESLEDPIDAQIKKEEQRKEAEKQAKIEAEQNRIGAIRARIEEIRVAGNTFTLLAGSVVIATHLEDTKAVAIDDSFGEFKADAEAAKVEAVVKLTELREAALKYEADQRQIRADREELERRRIEDEARRKEAADKEAAEILRRAEEQAKAQAEIDRQAREARLKREADDRKAQEARDEQDRVARIAREAEERKAREQQQRAQMAMSEIQGIQQQVMIAQIGRAGVRVGGTIACIEETLAETEAWPIEEKTFGALTGSAQAAKDAAIASIKDVLAAAKHRAEEDERRKAEAARLAELAKREEEERAAAEQKAREEKRKADELLDLRDLLVTFRHRSNGMAEFAKVHKAIDQYMTDSNKQRKAA